MALSRHAKLWTVSAIVALLGGGGWWAWSAHAKKKEKAAKEEEAVAEVTRGDLETRFQELGDVHAKRTVDVASKVSGRIIELDVHEGESVAAGQKLAVVQPGKTETERYLPSTVQSPLAGVVLSYVKEGSQDNANGAFVHVGDYVTGIFENAASPTYLMTIADMRTVIVKMRINEMDILKLHERMPVDVYVDAIPDVKFAASVSMISSQAEREQKGGKAFRVEVTLAKPDARFRTGMTARVDALLERRPKALRLPLTGLFEEKGAEVAYLKPAVKGAKARQVVLKTGMRTEIEAEVLAGLKEGDKVLTEKPLEFDPAPAEELRKAAQERESAGLVSKRDLAGEKDDD